MDCKNCEYKYVCCSTDAWRIPLTASEASSITPRIKLANGQFVLASKSNGMCYFHNIDGTCSIYKNRPKTCCAFSCDGKENLMKDLLEKLNNTHINLESSHAGFVVAFTYSTDKTMAAGKLKIINQDNGKEIEIPVAQVFGNSEDDVRIKLIKVLNQPFKEENI